MTKVIAAIDDTPAARPVLETARAIARLFDAALAAAHVGAGPPANASRECDAAGVRLRVIDGEVVPSLVAVGRGGDVAALVLGTRDTPSEEHPVGSTALEVIERLDKPLVVVPPRAPTPERIERVLLPLDGTAETSLAPASVLEVARDADVDVAALVLGTRDTPSEEHPVGSTALEVIERLDKPLVVVPPRAPTPERIERVLLPLDGTAETSLAPASVLEVARDADVDVVVVHVLDESRMPLFTDQPQHETETWTNEFLERYCPHGLRSVELALRVGRPDDTILATAHEAHPDLVVLGWNGRLAPGRAQVVRALLARGGLPLLLVPAVADVDERRRVA